MPSSSRKSPVSLLEHLRTEKQQGPLTQADIAKEVKASLKVAQDVVLIPLELIDEGSFNPRRRFEEKELETLADTIGATGLVHPLLVRSNPEDPRRFETIAGARRLRAAHIVFGRGDPEERARVAELPCMIKELSDTQAFISAVAENASRSDLTLAEMIDAVRRLRDETRWSGSEIARRIGRHKAYVSELLAVADNTDLSVLVVDEVIAPKTAVVIAHMPDQLKRVAIERARNGQLRTKADAERLRMHHRLLQQPPSTSQAFSTSVEAGSTVATSQPPGAAGYGETTPEVLGQSSPANSDSATGAHEQGSPVNRSKANAPRQSGTGMAVLMGQTTIAEAGDADTPGLDARALRLAETMAVAVDAFVDYMREARHLPDNDPAIVLAQRARKSLAYFEAMRHVSS